MKMKYLVPLLVAISLVGCATNAPVDWNSRVGHYTYADAVRDLGQPDRQIRLSNGSTEFKWFPRTGPAPAAANAGSSFAVGGLNNPNAANDPGWTAANSGIGTGPGASHAFNRYLELTFNSDGVLTSWSKNY